MPSIKVSEVNTLKMFQAFTGLGYEISFCNLRIHSCATSSDLATFYEIGESINFCRLPRPRNRLKDLSAMPAAIGDQSSCFGPICYTYSITEQ